MDEQRVSKVLHEIAEEAVPDDVDLWPRLQARVAQRNGRAMPLRSAFLVGWPVRGRGLALTVGLALLVVVLGLIAMPKTGVDVVEFLGLDGVLVRETATASATVPTSAFTGTPGATPTPQATVQSQSDKMGSESTLTLAFEDTPLPTLTGPD